MTDLAVPSPSPELMSYLQVWADALARAVGEIAHASLSCVVQTESPSDRAPASPDDVWIVAGSSGALRGEMCLRLAPAVTVRLAQILLSEPAASAELTSEHREATLELLRQVSGLAASALRSQRGEVQLRLESATGAPSWPASLTAWFRIEQESTPILIEVLLSAALLASLRSEQPLGSELPAEPAALTSPANTRATSLEDEKVNLDLLMNVELEVTLRFGGRRMLLREILDLNPGSVIALDRQVQDSVDMVLDGRIVARGDVVVSGGNYALRVTEVGPAGR